MLIAGILIWPLVAWGFWAGTHSPDPRISSVTNLYLFYAVALALFVILASGAYRARAFGHMILLGPDQFPKLHGMVVEGAKALGMSNTPKTFIYNSNGLLNAFARRLFGGQYVFLTSALVDASDDEQVRFVIGHELGHHAAGHLNPWMNFLKLPGYVVPFLQPAHSRGREYTCDKLGLHVAKDVAVSQGALMMLGCGCRRLNPDMNRDAFMAQEAMVPPIFGFLTEIMQSHPRITRRLRAMRDAGGR
jgi:Zn-dependent protease with chaperone function